MDPHPGDFLAPAGFSTSLAAANFRLGMLWLNGKAGWANVILAGSSCFAKRHSMCESMPDLESNQLWFAGYVDPLHVQLVHYVETALLQLRL